GRLEDSERGGTKVGTVSEQSAEETRQVTRSTWLLPRDSNRDMLSQSQLSYHGPRGQQVVAKRWESVLRSLRALLILWAENSPVNTPVSASSLCPTPVR